MSEPERRVRFVAYRLDAAAGMERALLHLLRALAPRWSIELVVLRGGVPEPLRDLEQVADVRLVAMRPWRVLGAWLGRSAPRRTVVVGLWAGLLWLPMWLGPARCRTVLWEHSLVPHRIEHDRQLQRLQRVLWRMYRRPGCIVCVSSASADFVRDRASEGGARATPPFEVIPNIVELGDRQVRARVRRPGGRVRLLAAHRMRPHKQTGLSVEALALLPEGYELVIAGDGPERPAVEQLIDRLGLRPRVTTLGFVDDVGPLLAEADVLVHPSLAETFCLAVFEAAAAGVPVVCLATGSLVDSVPAHVPGVLVGVDAAAQDLADGIEAAVGLLGDDGVVREALERRLEVYAPAAVAQRWEALLEDARSS